MTGKRSRTTIGSSARARELIAAREAKRQAAAAAGAPAPLSQREIERLCRSLAPAALDALAAALQRPRERVAAARVILERALPDRALAALVDRGGGALVMLRMRLPGRDDDGTDGAE